MDASTGSVPNLLHFNARGDCLSPKYKTTSPNGALILRAMMPMRCLAFTRSITSASSLLTPARAASSTSDTDNASTTAGTKSPKTFEGHKIQKIPKMLAPAKKGVKRKAPTISFFENRRSVFVKHCCELDICDTVGDCETVRGQTISQPSES